MGEQEVSIALEMFRDLLVEEGKFLAGVSGEVRSLQRQLTEIKCLLRDADGKQHESESVRNWIAEIKDLANRAEDAIASYAVRIDGGRGLKQVLRRFSRGLNCFSLHQLGHEISDIKSELARVTQSMRDYGIRSIIVGEESSGSGTTNNNHKWTRKTFPNSEIGDCFVGKEDELERLCSLVGDADDEKLRVISVWGMGGIGKTTIAKKVYKHMIQAKKFNSYAWVCVTQQCQIRTVLESLLKQLDSEKGEAVSSLSDEQLIEQLCETQRAKRCLIVLDDLWEIFHWNGLKHAFLVEDLKSKILVTTRKKFVAEIGFSLKLGLLKPDEALELLMKKSFPHGNNPADVALKDDLHKIGKEMVRKCGYLPLAISLLGGVLSKKSSMNEWEVVYANMNSLIYRSRCEGGDRKDNQIETVLDLSYDDLPYYLKPCFLYLSILVEDEVFAQDIYRKWIAQSMISKDNTQGKEETLTEIAELYLSELESRCIVQVEVGVDDGSMQQQKYRKCKLHDVVRELCVKIATKEDFGAQILEYQGGKFSTLLKEALSSNKTRHLVIHFRREFQQELDDLVVPCEEQTSKHLRSLEIQSHVHGRKVEFPTKSIVDLRKFKMLKSLVIERFQFVGRKLPRGITNLVHLKYLGLAECELDKLPSSISNLVYLETLFLMGSWNIRIPNVLKKMFRLKHLILPLYNKYIMEKLDVGDELETLWQFDSSVHELKSTARMKNLRGFSAIISDNKSLSTIIDAISEEWTKLQYCALTIKRGCEFTTCEDGEMKLKQVLTCPNLYLKIHAPLGNLLAKCSSQIISSKFVELTLEYCEIEDDAMLILGKLPMLNKLFCYSRSFVGNVLTCPSRSFSRLTVLVFSGLPNWREWRLEEGAMPLLSEMHINLCPRFQKLPDGFSRISTLQKLTISGMPELGKRVSESGEDFQTVCHVPSVIIRNQSSSTRVMVLMDYVG